MEHWWINSKHQIYKFDCRNKKCNHDYIGETGIRKEVRENEHAGKDKKSHVFQHTKTTKHPCAKKKDFVILAKNYENRRKRKLTEAMFIRDLKPTLNKQKDSYKLVLFGWYLTSDELQCNIFHILQCFLTDVVSCFNGSLKAVEVSNHQNEATSRIHIHLIFHYFPIHFSNKCLL